MKKLFLFLLVSIFFFSFASAFNGTGTGTLADPYIITNWSTLNEIRNDLTGNYSLANNLTTSDSDYISQWTAIPATFTGNFDGNNNTIFGLSFSSYGSQRNWGFFMGTSGSNIKNLRFENVYLSGRDRITCLIYTATNTNITNVHVKNITYNTSAGYSGGLISSVGTGGVVYITNTGIKEAYIKSGGGNGYGIIQTADSAVSAKAYLNNVYFEGNITNANQGFGGLVFILNGAIENSYSKVNITQPTSSLDIGGLVAKTGSGGSYNISNSYSYMNVTVGTTLSGSIGGLAGTGANIISNSYSISNFSITSGGTRGAISGSNANMQNVFWYNDSKILNCSSTSNTNCTAVSSLEQMKNIHTYSGLNIKATNNNYHNNLPYLAWQTGENLGSIWLINYNLTNITSVTNNTWTVNLTDGETINVFENANLTFTSDADDNYRFSWFVDGIERLAGIGENTLNKIFNNKVANPSSLVTLQISNSISSYQDLTDTDTNNWMANGSFSGKEGIGVYDNESNIYYISSYTNSLGVFGYYNPQNNVSTLIKNFTDGLIQSLEYDYQNDIIYTLGSNANGYYNKTSSTWVNLSSILVDTVYSSVLDGNLLYISTANSFGYYNLTSNNYTSLTNPGAVYSLSFDKNNNIMYLAGGFPKKFYSYNISSNTTTDLVSKSCGGTFIWDSEYVQEDNLVYLGGSSGEFGAYNISSDSYINLSLTGGWLADVQTLKYDSVTELLYMGTNGGIAKFGSYNITSNVSTNVYNVTTGALARINSLDKGNNEMYMVLGDGYYGVYEFFTNIFTETYNITTNSSAPIINITYPVNGINYSEATDSHEFNYTFSDATDSTCWYSLNGGANISANCTNDNITTLTYNLGSNNIKFYANDSVGNLAYTSSTFNYTFFTITGNGTYNTTLINSNWEENANLTFINEANNSHWFSWIVDGVERLAGVGQNVFNWLFNNQASNPSSNVTLQISNANSSSSICYQESFNTSNQTGIDGDCGLTYNGNLTVVGGSLTGQSDAIDGNWNNYAVFFAPNKNVTFTYDIPSGAVSTIWMTKWGMNYYNISIYNNNTCWDDLSDNKFRIMISWFGDNSNPAYAEIYCGNNAQYLGNLTDIGVTSYFNEEAMSWNISTANILFNETYNITTDSQNPNIQITYPVNGATYYEEITALNYTFSDATASNCSYSINGGANESITCGDNVTSLSGIVLPGNYNITLFANDSVGNLVSATTTFNISVALDVIFVSQSPADIDSLNVVNNPANITYNISFSNPINTSTVFIYYKTNSSLGDYSEFINGTTSSGYHADGSSTNISNIFTFQREDNEIYPATYNLDDDVTDDTVHSLNTLDSANYYVATQLLNVSNSTAYNFFEIMSNSTSIQRLYYCNSSFIFTETPANSLSCSQITSIASNKSYDHCHSTNSCHQVIQLVINTTSGSTLGGVKVTSDSWFILRGNVGSQNVVNYYSVPNTSRIGATKKTLNGNTWTNQTYTLDAHLHQFSDDTSLYYYVCANDTSNNQACSSVRQDLMQLAGLPPASPNVFNPVLDNYYRQNITINYTQAVSPNGYAISYYNISLANIDGSFNKTIISNNSLNLGYIWNSSGTPDGQYKVVVNATDNLSQSSLGYSFNFYLDNTNPNGTLLTPLNNTFSAISSQNLTVNISDNMNLSNASLYINGVLNQTVTYVSGTISTVVGIVVVLADGIYNWFYSIFDMAGNQFITANNTLTIDTINPSYVLSAPASNSFFNTTSVLFNLTSSDSPNASIIPNLDNSLVSWYRMDDTSGATVIDYMNRNNGTNYGATQVTNGKFGKAFIFDGVNRGIDLASPVSAINTPNHTLCSWVLANGNSPHADIFSQEIVSGDDIEYNFRFQNDGKFILSSYRLGYENIITTTIYDRNIWHFACFTRNGTTSANIYVDGILSKSGTIKNVSLTNQAYIGYLRNGAGSSINGTIDEVTIFNRTLSADEILSLYNATAYTHIKTDLSQGSHTFNSYIQDFAGNINQTDVVTFSIDSISPIFTTIPANQSITYGSNWNGVQFNASDSNFSSYYLGNWTSKFQINSTGYLSNKTSLSAGTYIINVSINDTLGNTNTTWYNLTVNKASLTGALTSTKGWTYTYDNVATTIGYTESNSGDSDVVYKVYRVGVDKGSGETVNLPAGTYAYVLNSTGGENYSSSTAIHSNNLIINKASSSVGLSATSPITYGTATDFVGSNCPDATCSLNITNGVFSAGVVSANYSFAGNENYTGSYAVSSVTINKANSQTSLTFDKTSPQQYETAITPTCSLLIGDGSVSLTNGTSGVSEVLGAGSWLFNCSYSGNENYTASSNSSIFTIDKNNTYSLGITGTSPITYGTITDVAGSGCPSQLTCSLNQTNQIYSAGTQVFNYSTAGNENYTGSYAVSSVTINKGVGNITGSINGSQSNFTNEGSISTWLNLTNITGYGTGKIYVNGTLINSGNMPLSNYTTLGVGSYNVTFVYDGNENYTADSEVLWVTINDTLPPVITIDFPTTTNNPALVSFQIRTDEVSSCQYDIDTEPIEFLTTTDNLTHSATKTLGGTHSVIFYCNDSLNQQSNASITFSVGVTTENIGGGGGSSSVSSTPITLEKVNVTNNNWYIGEENSLFIETLDKYGNRTDVTSVSVVNVSFEFYSMQRIGKGYYQALIKLNDSVQNVTLKIIANDNGKTIEQTKDITLIEEPMLEDIKSTITGFSIKADSWIGENKLLFWLSVVITLIGLMIVSVMIFYLKK